MSHERFDIYFAGQILPEHSPDAVRQWLGAQFKIQGQALDQLFCGQPVRIKQGVDMDTAGRYRAAFRKAGALVEIRPIDAGTTATPAAPVQDEPQLLPANTGSLADCAQPVAPAPVPDIGHMSLDTPDRPLDDTPSPPAAQIDTSHLDALPANTGDLSDCTVDKPARPIPDISALQLTDD